MNDRISATEGALARGASVVSGAHIDIQDSVRRVLDELDELGGHWSGDAASAYTQLVGEWSAGAAKLNAVLVQLTQAMRSTDQDQQALEQQHGSTIGGLGALLGGD
ncbi:MULTISPECIES: WXG100 family type VII secretion target [unclassified Microbacterium]|uniref:WXG100 family type VII secretion target n=1 Tax=unclassified Microbacterium TaxID=2609290 RepID=UPI00214CC752|nr:MULTISPECIES: WXG100 family type VII secretion target [unclassified Microbacterium]MCR2784680.1 WXG100 family type VII secretion target [Microbacterium sp. zg.B96]MDL5352869.1 WXG100 family type VII secretion target [Microbacterium sp. zg-YB36]WIM16221.1 WXG100 family type VII secretion target [Microbacterium sp. zg-B96]